MQKLTKKQEAALASLRIDVAYVVHEGKPGFAATIEVLHEDEGESRKITALSSMLLNADGKNHARLAHVDVIAKFVSTLILGQMMGPDSFTDAVSALENNNATGNN